MTNNWTPEAARERLAAAEQHRAYLADHPTDRFGSGTAWAQREQPRLDAHRAEKAYLYGVARDDLTHALDRIAALEALLAVETECMQLERMYEKAQAEIARLWAALSKIMPSLGLRRCNQHDRTECLSCGQMWPRSLAADEGCRACTVRAERHPEEG